MTSTDVWADPSERQPVWLLILLGFGIYVAPYVFAWFTLGAGYPRWYRIISFVYAALIVAIGAAFVLFWGDHWPVHVENKTGEKIGLTYKHADYDHWSARFEIGPREETLLDREHYLKDIEGVQISDGGRSLWVSPDAMSRMKQICPGRVRCTLAYWGNRKIEVSR